MLKMGGGKLLYVIDIERAKRQELRQKQKNNRLAYSNVLKQEIKLSVFKML